MRKDVHENITRQIITDIENGNTPWEKPWKNNCDQGVFGIPMNTSTGKSYRGINVVALWYAASVLGTNDLRFMTFKQAKDAGGHVRKGERGHKIFVYKDCIGKRENSAGETETYKFPMAREFTVFQIDQIEGCDHLKANKPAAIELPTDTNEFCHLLDANLRHGGNRACYIPSADAVHMPVPQDFTNLDHYRGVLFHELTHWTGHKSRLDRKFGTSSNKREAHYAREELVAELGAAFLCAEFGIGYKSTHAGYIKNYLDVLKGDNRAIFRAASQAQKAVDHMRDTILANNSIAIAAE